MDCSVGGEGLYTATSNGRSRREKRCRSSLTKRRSAGKGRTIRRSLQTAVDDLLVGRYALVKGDDGFYYENDQEDGFFGFMSSALILKDRDWFLDNVDTWLWYNSDDMPEPDMFSVEDAKEFFLSKRAEAV